MWEQKKVCLRLAGARRDSGFQRWRNICWSGVWRDVPMTFILSPVGVQGSSLGPSKTPSFPTSIPPGPLVITASRPPAHQPFVKFLSSLPQPALQVSGGRH
ncbi:hypothetical protein LIA77_01320 [Sarocladium implicatum]|nr:hypothetical protein LIA77_01320 [Sarocladium implicatum]